MSTWKTSLLVAHRYLGIALSLFFVLWFASGFVIIYTGGMPRITEAERLQHLPPLALEQVSVSPAQAQTAIGTDSLPVLSTIMARPAYRFADNKIVFADTGERLTSAMVSSARIAAGYLGVEVDDLRRTGTVTEVDQWTIGLRGLLPLEKFVAEDEAKSEIYISPSRAEVVLHTTSFDRLLAWVGAIPHWLYFVQLRKNTELWSGVVIGIATLATIMALVGFVLLLIRLQWRHLPNLRAAIPYRGIMGWHSKAGLLFGVFVITWAFSGLLSMEPYQWTRTTGLNLDIAEYRGQTVAGSEYSSDDGSMYWDSITDFLGGRAIKEIRFRSFLSVPFLELTVAAPQSGWQHEIVRLQPGATSRELVQFDSGAVSAQLASSVSAAMVDVDVLDQYDSYYYGRESSGAPTPPLPVLRARFDDEDQTTFYIDLATGDPVYRSHRWNRLERWLYRGLHSLDFSLFYSIRPLWDLLVIFLLTGGTVLVLLGVVLSYRSVRRLL